MTHPPAGPITPPPPGGPRFNCFTPVGDGDPLGDPDSATLPFPRPKVWVEALRVGAIVVFTLALIVGVFAAVMTSLGAVPL